MSLLYGNIFWNQKQNPDDYSPILQTATHSPMVELPLQNAIFFAEKDAAFRQYPITVLLDGWLYNKSEVLKRLQRADCTDAQCAYHAWQAWGMDSVKFLDGSFTLCVWDEKKQTVHLACDRTGSKTLYYYHTPKGIAFCNQMQFLRHTPGFAAQMDEAQLMHLFGFSPALLPGQTVLKNVFALRNAQIVTVQQNLLEKEQYWQLKYTGITNVINDVAADVRYLLKKNVERAVGAFENVQFFLSGGIDSTALAALGKQKLGGVSTWSVEYDGNDEYFTGGDYQPEPDADYVCLASAHLKSAHTQIVLQHEELEEYLFEAMLQRGFPGMADVDSSLLCFTKQIPARNLIGGECADELFGGYPWFYREIDNTYLPWGGSMDLRQSVMHPQLRNKLPLGAYVTAQIEQLASETPQNTELNERDNTLQQLYYLCLQLFMPVLVTRNNTMPQYSGTNVLSPFCDASLMNYAFNIPWEMKFLYGREKGILRKAVSDLVPTQILTRKKSPFPKTYHPQFTAQMQRHLQHILQNKNSLLHDVCDADVLAALAQNPAAVTRPWFGQLMTGPQLMGYFIQLHGWLHAFNVNLA